MSYPLAVAFLFSVGAMLGWGIEFLFRNLISHRGPKDRYFINPGFCKGPWLPIYGVGLSLMFIISWIVSKDSTAASAGGKLMVILLIAAMMTVTELIGGLFLLKAFNLRLWDYRDRPGNFMGVVCPLFSLIWSAMGAAYYIFIHPAAIGWLTWLSQNLSFSFFVGLFYGVFIIDLIVSVQQAGVIKRFGDEHGVIVRYEELKELVQKKLREEGSRQSFFDQARKRGAFIADSLREHIAAATEAKKEAFISKIRKKR